MLVQSQKLPYNTVIKLLSGEEFICKVVDENDEYYTVEKPLTLGQTPQGITFVPIMYLIDQDRPIKIPKPVITGVPSSDVDSKYTTATSSIVVAPASILS